MNEQELKDKGFYWKIKTLDDVEYELEITFYSKDKSIMARVLKGMKAAKRNIGVDLKFQLENLQHIVISEQYYKMLNGAIKREVKEVAKTTARDGMRILNSRVIAADMRRKDDRELWKVQVLIRGDYAEV